MIGTDLVIWNDDLATGVEIIDAQHRMLFNLINDTNTTMAADASAKTLGKITLDLLAYTLFHFDTEEKLMEEYHYVETHLNDSDTHIRQHREFSNKVQSILDGIKEGNLISREELILYLNNWLVDHIIDIDKRLATFILSKNRAL